MLLFSIRCHLNHVALFYFKFQLDYIVLLVFNVFTMTVYNNNDNLLSFVFPLLSFIILYYPCYLLSPFIILYYPILSFIILYVVVVHNFAGHYTSSAMGYYN